MFYEELLKKRHVRSHPLVAGAKSRQIRKQSNSKFTNLLKQVRAQVAPTDIFAKHNVDLMDGGDQKLVTLQIKAVEIVRDFLDQFEFPMQPQIRLTSSKSVKRAEVDPEKVLSAVIHIEAKCTTLTNVHEFLEIPVSIVKGSVIPPSVVYHKGREALLTQGFVDEVIRRSTSYQLPQVTKSWNAPPMSHETRQSVVDLRNEQGYQPVVNPANFTVIRTASLRRRAQMWGWSNTETRNAFLEIVNSPEFRNLQAAASSTDELAQMLELEYTEMYPDVSWREIAMLMIEGQTVAASTHRRRAVKTGVPTGWKAVISLLEEAEASAEDTFPRPYHYIAQHYIAEVLSTHNAYEWEIHLINAGFAINPRSDGNRGYRSARSLKHKSKYSRNARRAR